MNLSRANLMVKHCASTDAKQPALNRVHVEEDGSTVAANENNMLMAVSPVVPEMEELFPMVDDNDGVDVGLPSGGVGLSLTLVNDVEKSMPRDRRVSLQQAQMLRCDDDVVEMLTTNGVKKMKPSGMPMRGRFPQWKKSVRKAKQKADRGRVCVNGKHLKALLEAMLKACPDRGNFNPVWIEFGDENSPLVLRGINTETAQHALGIIAPLDTGGEWVEPSKWEQKLGRKPVRVKVKRRKT